MTTYRLWPSTNGGSLTSYTSTPFIGAVQFAVYGGGNWFDGYWQWVPAGGDTEPVKCALWSLTSTTTGAVVPGSVVTSGTLTANQWNYVPLSTPIQLAPGWDKNNTASGSIYIAAIGINGAAGDTAKPSAGFADTNPYWASGSSGGNGITNGPLIAYSSSDGASNKAPYGMAQGLFSTAGADPSLHLPLQVSSDGNFWVDVQIDTVAPGSYAGSYLLWPNKSDANNFTSGDAAVDYTIATEVSLSQTCALDSIRYFSPKLATTLATRCDVWNISTGLSVASITSPSWVASSTGSAFTAGSSPDGGAGTWIKAAFAGGLSLPAGDYRVSVFDANGASDANWSAKDAQTDYWGETATDSVGAAGITSGPISAPGYSSASSGYIYNSGDPGNTPPYGASPTSHAQPPFGQNPGGTLQFPQLYAPVNTNQAQNYWVDLEVTPLNTITGSGGVTLPKMQLSGSGSSLSPITGSGGVILPKMVLAGSQSNRPVTSRSLVRQGVGAYLGGTWVEDIRGYQGGSLTANGLGTVRVGFPKRLDFNNFVAGAAAGRGMGAFMIVTFAHEREYRRAMAGPPVSTAGTITSGGIKFIQYTVTLHVFHIAQKGYAEDAQADVDLLIEAIKQQIRLDRTLGGICTDAGETTYGIQVDESQPGVDGNDRTGTYFKVTFDIRCQIVA